MSKPTLDDTDAQAAREQWFRYLDVIEPVRQDLHGFCCKLTASIWDAEDLVQDALLKGFAMVARGDLHGEHSPVRNAKAYLFRVATNQWIDQQRKARRARLLESIEVPVEDREPGELRPAMAKALSLSSAQEFVALLLKEGYDFSLAEIADFVGTSQGTIKSALSRARLKMKQAPADFPVDADCRALAEQFAQAINEQDLNGLMQLMSESMSIVVCNVGGGRGRSQIWTEKSVREVTARYAEYQGEALVVLLDTAGWANDVVKIDGAGGQVTRLVDYCYAPETLQHVAQALNLPMSTMGYHQPPQELLNMIATTTLPWRSD